MLEAVVRPAAGTAADTAGSSQILTRGQLVSLVVRALRSGRPEAVRLLPVGYVGTVMYEDPDHGEALRLAERNHLLDGVVGFAFDWDVWRPATRGEAAQILANVLESLDGAPAGGAAPGTPGGGLAGALAAPGLSSADTVTIVRDRIFWQIVSSVLDLREVETSMDPRGFQVLHVVLGPTPGTSPAEAVRQFMRRGMAGVVSIAAALNAGRGAQIGLVRVELVDGDGVTLVSHSGGLEDRRTSLTWDPSVADEVNMHLQDGSFGVPPAR